MGSEEKDTSIITMLRILHLIVCLLVFSFLGFFLNGLFTSNGGGGGDGAGQHALGVLFFFASFLISELFGLIVIHVVDDKPKDKMWSLLASSFVGCFFAFSVYIALDNIRFKISKDILYYLFYFLSTCFVFALICLETSIESKKITITSTLLMLFPSVCFLLSDEISLSVCFLVSALICGVISWFIERKIEEKKVEFGIK